MELEFFFKGIILGFAVAAPVGPIGLLCIRRSLGLGVSHGFATGLGAAAADSLYGVIAGFGLSAISSLLIAQETWIRLVGGIFLAYLGVKTLLAKPATQEAASESTSVLSSFFSSLFLTVTNPMTILSFAAAFAGLGLATEGGNYIASSMLVLGVFLGSAAWWLILSSVTGFFRKKISSNALVWINRVSGVLILAFACVALVNVL